MLGLDGSPLTVTCGLCCVALIMPPTVISSWLVRDGACMMYISCPLGVVEQYKVCLHSTGEEYVHSLAHYCCYGCNTALTCIIGIQL